MKYLITLFSAFVLFSCATKNTSKYSKIEYDAGACFGFCPIFKLQINPDRTAIIEAERFTFTDGRSKGDFDKPKEGTFKTTLKEADYNKLIVMLNNLNINSLQDLYKNKNVSDLPTSFLKITFADGKMKTIEDYGKNGTPKLREVYQFLESLPKTQIWTKISE